MRRTIFLATTLLSTLFFACNTISQDSELITADEYNSLLAHTYNESNSGIEGIYPTDSIVARYGKLHVTGTQLCNEKGDKVQLNGIYLRALENESKFLNDGCFDVLSRKWKIDVIRIPFMSASWYSEPSYIGSQYYESLIDKAVELSEKYGIYCIIDWHILADGNPLLHVKESMDFFKRIAYKYGAKKHVIYEICNEPNGENVTWTKAIKPYANVVIPVIKAGDPNAVIIVGTGNWSKDIEDAAKDPLQYTNIMYAFHFYSGSNKQDLRLHVGSYSEVIPLFASEWGNSNYDAKGGPFIAESQKWIELMNKRGISWCHYALTDYYEDAAMLRPNVSINGSWEDKDLTPSGKFIVDYFKSR